VSYRDKLLEIQDAQKSVLIRRDTEIRGVWLTLLSGQHGFLFGPPGVAKSMIVEDVSRYFPDMQYFYNLMGKHTSPEDLFGPLSISALRDDRHARNIEAYLPTADIAFLDEGFKANGAILNTNLQIMNERKFRNDAVMLNVPLKSMFVASNEIPTDPELAAMYDRILFRFNVADLEHPSDFRALLEKETAIKAFLQAAPVVTFSGKDFAKIREAVNNVTVPRQVMGDIVSIRDTLAMDHNIRASSRRWLQTLQGIRAHAYLSGRDEAVREDLQPLTYMLWSHPREIADVETVVWAVANPTLYAIRGLKDLITILSRDIEKSLNNARGNEINLVMADYTAKIGKVQDDVYMHKQIAAEEFHEAFNYMEDYLHGQKLRLAHLAADLDIAEGMAAGKIIPWEPERI